MLADRQACCSHLSAKRVQHKIHDSVREVLISLNSSGKARSNASLLECPFQIFGTSERLFLDRIDPRRSHIGSIEIRMIQDHPAKIGAARLRLSKGSALQIGAGKIGRASCRE